MGGASLWGIAVLGRDFTTSMRFFLNHSGVSSYVNTEAMICAG